MSIEEGGSVIESAGETATRRSYQSPRRLAAAQQTRARIREAAATLFLADGYAATSMRTIAQTAGVAEKTVYLQFENKPALLKEVVETAIVGDDEAIPAADRNWFRDTVSDPDLDRKLRRLVDATAALHERSGAMFAMARDAAATDAEAAVLWAFGKRGHRADMTRLAQSFRDSGQLPVGLDLDWATTTLYVLLGLESWHLVRVELAFDEQQYRDWLHGSLRQAFRAS
ncbi:MAG: TetR/AcrR family transcriptional regulator [Propionibacteriaceae bacterium]